jgi:hypothetical protein
LNGQPPGGTGDVDEAALAAADRCQDRAGLRLADSTDRRNTSMSEVE